MMKTIAVASIVASATAFVSNPSSRNVRNGATFQQIRMSDNANMFGGEKAVETTPVVEAVVETEPAVKGRQSQKYEDQAAKLRQEAADMEVAMREEARAKGLPEEMINKLIPLPRQPSAPKSEGTVLVEEKVVALTAAQVRAKLGYLNTGDAVRMSSELERIKQKGTITKWNAKDIGIKPNFAVSNGQLTSRTKIDPLKLKLDDVGYAYQNVFVAALVIGGVLGVSSSFIGGQLGFILGYSSALIPITLVGLGSIAPSLIGDILARFKYATNKEARDQYVHMNAGTVQRNKSHFILPFSCQFLPVFRYPNFYFIFLTFFPLCFISFFLFSGKFLVGYVLGLPVSRFDAGGPSNTVDFFQLRPTSSKPDAESKLMFKQTTFKQMDIARCSASCLGGNVAECIMFGQSAGTNPGDVNLLNEIIGAVQPAMTPEATQSHIRWSALTAYDIITEYKEEYLRLVEAFREGLPLEECIAAIEGEGSAILTNQ